MIVSNKILNKLADRGLTAKQKNMVWIKSACGNYDYAMIPPHNINQFQIYAIGSLYRVKFASCKYPDSGCFIESSYKTYSDAQNACVDKISGYR